MRSVELPHNWLSPAVIERIATFPNLTEFEAIHTSPQADDPQPFSTPLPVDSFPELKSLSIIVPYKHAISAFSQNYRPHLLTTLSIRTPIYEYSADFGSLTSIIGADCVNLEMLRLNSTPLDAMPFPYSIPHNDFVTFEHIQPLLRCRKLRTLSLFHNRPFQLSSDEVIALFAALPLLAHVYLNDTPDLNGPGLPLAVLNELPRHTRNLMFLQLYLDASVTTLPDVDLKPFKRLRILGVGHSLISDPLPVAKVLTRVLPEWCDIFCSTHYDPPMDEEDDDVRHEKWRTVAGLVKAMTIAREEGRTAVCRRDE
ncbi:hypothetical protein ONZ45_g5541 [Pleurotus djamor]|nr:hypothetical protein ONZ45_g5541 [Pleurotus djamor]